MMPKPNADDPSYQGSGKLQNKAAIITGGDSGIGRAVAIAFAKEGADVAIVYLNEHEDAEETRRRVEQHGRRCITIAGDIGDESFCQQAVKQAVNDLGRLDILVNNAAEQHPQDSITKISAEQLERTFRTNIFGMFFMTKAALPHLAEGSAIVNTGSITGLEGSKELLDYASTKGAIHAFTKSLAQNLVERGIRVNCVAPGPVWTPLNPADKEPKDVAEFGADTPFKRPAQPEEIAPAYVYFASEIDSSYVTGEILTLLGGETTAG
jgi:NAD(P)-dependent dehydrogenase (short-subunit alcohol dehydrogenase family)